jgi:dephospho-CoA kinase
MIIGLTGSIAMGKSEVAKTLRSMGIAVFDADATVHQIYQDGTAARALHQLCPEAISGSKVDRKILSNLITKNPNLLKSVTAIIHPLIHKAEQEFLNSHKDEIVVIDSPLILEGGRAREMDVLIVVSATAELQKSRALARTGMTVEKFDMILSKQMPDDEKRKWADYVIENNGSLEELATVTKALVAEIKSKHHA